MPSGTPIQGLKNYKNAKVIDLSAGNYYCQVEDQVLLISATQAYSGAIYLPPCSDSLYARPNERVGFGHEIVIIDISAAVTSVNQLKIYGDYTDMSGSTIMVNNTPLGGKNPYFSNITGGCWIAKYLGGTSENSLFHWTVTEISGSGMKPTRAEAECFQACIAAGHGEVPAGVWSDMYNDRILIDTGYINGVTGGYLRTNYNYITLPPDQVWEMFANFTIGLNNPNTEIVMQLEDMAGNVYLKGHHSVTNSGGDIVNFSQTGLIRTTDVNTNWTTRYFRWTLYSNASNMFFFDDEQAYECWWGGHQVYTNPNKQNIEYQYATPQGNFIVDPPPPHSPAIITGGIKSPPVKFP